MLWRPGRVPGEAAGVPVEIEIEIEPESGRLVYPPAFAAAGAGR
jgi:hypothetical protein